jgi:hypothetical protein
MLHRDDLAPTHRVFNVPHREVDSAKSMQYHAKLQSILERVMELERRLRIVRGEKYLRRERIQLGLDVSVAGERRVWASGFPFMMVLLALITMSLPNVYKYMFST